MFSVALLFAPFPPLPVLLLLLPPFPPLVPSPGGAVAAPLPGAAPTLGCDGAVSRGAAGVTPASPTVVSAVAGRPSDARRLEMSLESTKEAFARQEEDAV